MRTTSVAGMILEEGSAAFEAADWLFSIGEGQDLPVVDGLVPVDGYVPHGRAPEEVAMVEKARGYGARAVFFEAARHGRAPVAHAFVFAASDDADDARFAVLHKRLWSWGGVPLVFRASPGRIQLFRCAHEPDFVGKDNIPNYPFDKVGEFSMSYRTQGGGGAPGNVAGNDELGFQSGRAPAQAGEPLITPEMVAAGVKAYQACEDWSVEGLVTAIYRAMLDASGSVPTDQNP
jgi:hypothetical protein